MLDTSDLPNSLAAGNPADAAYEAAGYRKHRGNAARLSANEHVKDRVKEIQAIGAERASKGKNEFWKIYNDAKKDPAWFHMMLKASESGIIVGR
jgi:hypothetical protein